MRGGPLSGVLETLIRFACVRWRRDTRRSVRPVCQAEIARGGANVNNAAEPIRVLIVDDQTMIAESLRRLLDSCEGIAVVGVAGTGADGISLSSRVRPHVALMDSCLPDIDGVTAAARIRADNPEVRVVILTSPGGDDRVALRAIEAGCCGFITKDGTIDELLASVRAAHAGEALIAPSMLIRLLPRLERDYHRVGHDLSPREREVLDAMARGLSDKEIADRLTISFNTARKHVQNVIRKLGAHSKLEAVVTAVREGVVRPL
jgi:DNA-binding NarL/FixJ family response regulator